MRIFDWFGSTNDTYEIYVTNKSNGEQTKIYAGDEYKDISDEGNFANVNSYSRIQLLKNGRLDQLIDR